ncbi:bifunctional arginine demethylase and lysyl-hydroxylase JMJD6-A [Anastrepha ludens]|uniref:bifunctional arginine demethylase and lysyl-hydroxylase JMJD6-A n=1 Tax=Anastrepha ludens TaxID=28586 RepID=UPI0023B04043|nr:bifunctional arginine demethylase and lysyl-hydroxylase JMJD6-A [Anastrepha ludens]
MKMCLEESKLKLQQILIKCKDKCIDPKAYSCVQKFISENESGSACRSWKLFKFCLIFALLAYGYNYFFNELSSKRCLLELPRALRYALRPPEDCAFCENIESAVRLRGVTSEEFASKYAYTGGPVIVEDATTNWTAPTKFDYWYFRDIYMNAKRKQKILDCQFLPYKTGFRDIFKALDMPKERVELQPGNKPWYFGWSNCNPETAEELRRHYGRPYFLPPTSENNAVDWFFIGTAGLGAHMHIDNVRLPSWQAQLSGSKRWLLAPPPECYFRCKRFDTIVRRGDIIVLDTNKWYHQTFVQPGEVSLTIGAEYD